MPLSKEKALCAHRWIQRADQCSNLNPGGWVEYQDFDLEYKCDDDTVTEEHSMRKWMNALMDASKRIGRNPAPGPNLEGWVKDAGFKDVQSQKIKIPIGTWPKDPELKEIGLCNLAQVLDGLEAFTLRLFRDVLGWKQEEVIVLLSLVRKELKSAKLHAYLTL